MTTPADETDPATAAAKAALRARVRATRRARLDTTGAAGRARDADRLTHHGMPWLTEQAVRCLTAYEPMPTEPPVHTLVGRLHAADVRVLLPITLNQGRLRWRATSPTHAANPQGSADVDDADHSDGPEIVHDVDMALIPALAVSAEGVRLGQGGGYYDRWVPALRAARPHTLVVAVLYPDEIGLDVPGDTHDITVDAVLSIDGITVLAPTSG